MKARTAQGSSIVAELVETDAEALRRRLSDIEAQLRSLTPPPARPSNGKQRAQRPQRPQRDHAKLAARRRVIEAIVFRHREERAAIDL